MRVGLHGQHISIDGQRVAVGVDVVAATSSDIEVLPAESEHVTGSRGPLVGEVQADAHLHRLWLRAGHAVKLNDEIALWLEAPAHAIGRHTWRLPRRPPEKYSIGKLRFAAAASFVTGARLILVATSRLARAIDLDVGVMHHLAVAWQKLDRLYIRDGIRPNRDDERAKDIAPSGRKHVRFRHPYDDIRCSEPPYGRRSWRWRQILRIAARHPVRDPRLNRRNFRSAHTPL